MITNKQITNQEKKLLEFFISQSENQKDKIESQINRSAITRDCTPYYLILKFDVKDAHIRLLSDYNFDSTIQVIHEGSAPTVFILFIKNGLIQEFEVYNGDSSYMDYDTLCDGKVLKEF